MTTIRFSKSNMPSIGTRVVHYADGAGEVVALSGVCTGMCPVRVCFDDSPYSGKGAIVAVSPSDLTLEEHHDQAVY